MDVTNITEKLKSDPDSTLNNPWLVTNLDTFLYYNCPECDMKTKEYDSFYDHAIQNHPNSKIAEWYEEPLDIKPDVEPDDTINDVEDQDMSEPVYEVNTKITKVESV